MEVKEKQPVISEIASKLAQAEKEYLDLKADYIRVTSELKRLRDLSKSIYPIVVAHILSRDKLELSVSDHVMLSYQEHHFSLPIVIESGRQVGHGQVFTLKIQKEGTHGQSIETHSKS